MCIYYTKVSGIPNGNKLIKTIRYPHMCIDMISSHVCEDIDDFTDIKFFSLIVLKFVAVSSKHLRVFLKSLQPSSEIFGDVRKFSENVREYSSGLRNNFGKSLEIFGKWLEIFGKSSKMPSAVCLYNKKNITR